MIISENQANQIASCIVFDIQDFIKEHQAEYELFLKEELEKEKEKKINGKK